MNLSKNFQIQMGLIPGLIFPPGTTMENNEIFRDCMINSHTSHKKYSPYYNPELRKTLEQCEQERQILVDQFFENKRIKAAEFEAKQALAAVK